MRIVMFAGLALTLAACGNAVVEEVPLGAPEYQQPSNAAGKKAFKAALKYDRVDNPVEIDKEKLHDVGMMTYQNSIRENKKMLANRAAKRMLSAYRRMDIKTCEWQRVDERRVPRKSRIRLAELPEAAWLCEFDAHYQTNRNIGKKVFAASSGYFFKQGGSFDYAGPYKDPYD